MDRIILHIDFDMFFAAVELLDNPMLKNKAIAVALPKAKRGIITTASYEARKFGIGSGMAIDIAKRKCPDLTLVSPRMWKYEKINRIFREIVSQYTDRYEFVALDEAYLDITYTYEFYDTPDQLAVNIQKDMYRKTGCTCSVGLGYNKISAKLASEKNKPNGFGKLKTQKEFIEYTAEKKLTKINGIGNKMAENLYHLFYKETLGQLREVSLDELRFYLGKPGITIYHMIRGIDSRIIGDCYKRDGYASRQTFQKDIFGREEVLKKIVKRIEEASWQMKKDNKSAYTVSLIIRYSEGFYRITKNKTLKNPVKEPLEIYKVIEKISEEVELDKFIRQIGVRLSKTGKSSKQYQLSFGEEKFFTRKKEVFKLTYELKKKFGRRVILDPLEASSR
ncbi:DNA polymerase IV [uncultured Ilyobacter sp.]|uniref:DNA polymerase IV n=1 Tax=uncultured Ilyobacter sp. TaxID=544433 RepID=UPI002AA723BA|nr:DNA polymerase IV [uncultured Ilyobacter sp.]